MIRLLLIAVATVTLNAGLFDFMTLKKADEAYAEGRYEKAAKLYEELAKDGSEEAKFNRADSLYKAGRYSEALKVFKSLSKGSLEFKRLHNMGNCYAKLEKIDEAIDAYEKALKIKEDSDTRFNLELLKRLKEQKRQKENRSRKDDKKQQKSEKSGKNLNSKEKDKRNGESGESKGEKRTQKDRGSNGKDGKKESGKKSGEEKDRKDGKSEKQRRESGERESKEMRRDGGKITELQKDEPISEMELRKWNKVFGNREINTLMLPLDSQTQKGEPDEKSPW
ncbi:MAG: tetratricopeptide repeat protein [Hydrogenimonas sp.]|nr:tetratricopeptide repeat protein [Hydrogenimonas sp.]